MSSAPAPSTPVSRICAVKALMGTNDLLFSAIINEPESAMRPFLGWLVNMKGGPWLETELQKSGFKPHKESDPNIMKNYKAERAKFGQKATEKTLTSGAGQRASWRKICKAIEKLHVILFGKDVALPFGLYQALLNSLSAGGTSEASAEWPTQAAPDDSTLKGLATCVRWCFGTAVGIWVEPGPDAGVTPLLLQWNVPCVKGDYDVQEASCYLPYVFGSVTQDWAQLIKGRFVPPFAPHLSSGDAWLETWHKHDQRCVESALSRLQAHYPGKDILRDISLHPLSSIIIRDEVHRGHQLQRELASILRTEHVRGFGDAIFVFYSLSAYLQNHSSARSSKGPTASEKERVFAWMQKKDKDPEDLEDLPYPMHQLIALAMQAPNKSSAKVPAGAGRGGGAANPAGGTASGSGGAQGDDCNEEDKE